MIGALLPIAGVGGLVYLVRGQRSAARDQASDKSPEASRRSAEE
jgi:hypothetical protein